MQTKPANKKLMEIKENKKLKIAEKNKGLYVSKRFEKIDKYNKYKSILLFLLFGDKGISHLFQSKRKQIKKKVINYRIMGRHLIKTKKNNMPAKCLTEKKIKNVIE